MDAMTFLLIVLAVGFGLGLAGVIIMSAAAHKHYDEMAEVPRRYKRCDVLLVSDMREADLYVRAYPDLLNDIYKVCLVRRPQDYEGLRVSRVYATQTIDLYNEELCVLTQYLQMAAPGEADPMPIQLRLDSR